jgi:pimeloyl-ACP methyl ester carboxylesterase
MTQLHWESTGEGEPVLLIMGLGMNATGWWRTVPVLAERFRVIAFDNRGVGRSPRTPGPYTVAQMADDAAGVLDAAGEETAHVYGISLGGMIAQQVALRYPDRVRSLVLGATTPGGDHAVAASQDVQDFLRLRERLTAETAVWASVPINYAPATRRDHGDRIAADIAQRLRFPIEREPYAAQLAAALGHDAGARLPEIHAPTLVVHGREDVLIPPGNAGILAERIAGAEARVYEGAAHLYFTDVPEIEADVRDWISARSSRDPSAAPPR